MNCKYQSKSDRIVRVVTYSIWQNMEVIRLFYANDSAILSLSFNKYYVAILRRLFHNNSILTRVSKWWWRFSTHLSLLTDFFCKSMISKVSLSSSTNRKHHWSEVEFQIIFLDRQRKHYQLELFIINARKNLNKARNIIPCKVVVKKKKTYCR